MDVVVVLAVVAGWLLAAAVAAAVLASVLGRRDHLEAEPLSVVHLDAVASPAGPREQPSSPDRQP